MRVKAKVKQVEEKYALVESERLSACEGCHKHAEGCSVCSLMGSNKIISAKAKNSVGAEVGDTVEIETETKTVLFYAMLVFILPVAVMLVLYGGASMASVPEALCYVLAFGGFVLTFAGLGLYSRLRVSKKYDAQIIRIIEKKKED